MDYTKTPTIRYRQGNNNLLSFIISQAGDLQLPDSNLSIKAEIRASDVGRIIATVDLATADADEGSVSGLLPVLAPNIYYVGLLFDRTDEPDFRVGVCRLEIVPTGRIEAIVDATGLNVEITENKQVIRIVVDDNPSASIAAYWANQVRTDKDAAETAKDAAFESQTAAASSASTASQKAVEAGISEENAAASAQAAAASEELADQHAQGIGTALADVTAVQTDINTTKGLIDASQQDVTTKAGQVATAKQAVDTAKQAIDVAKGQVDTAKQAVDTTKGQIDTIKTAIDGIQTDVTTKQQTASTAAATATNKAAEATTKAGEAATSAQTALNALGSVQAGVSLGPWNVLTNTPALTADASAITAGGYYNVTVAGNSTFAGQNFNSGQAFSIGDRLAKVGNQWYRIPQAVANGSITLQALSEQLVTQLTNASLPGYELPTFAKVEIDEQSRIAWWIDMAGKFGLPNVGDVAAAIQLLQTLAPVVWNNESGYAYGIQDTTGKVGIGLDFAANLVHKGVTFKGNVAQSLIDILAMLTAGQNIRCAGDSLTAGAGGTSYPTQLAAMFDPYQYRTVSNGGLGGDTSTQIAFRHGAISVSVQVAGNQIPASGSVAVTPSDNSIMQNGQSVTATLSHVVGVFARDSSGNYTFTRAVPGSVVVTDKNPMLNPHTSAWDSGILIIDMGRNDYLTPNTVLANIDAMVAMQKTLNKRFLIGSIINGNYASEYVGQSGYNTIIGINNTLKAKYPRNYVEIREALVRSYDPGIAQDVIDFNNDVPPSSKRSDPLHLNTAGYGIKAQLYYNAITAKNW